MMVDQVKIDIKILQRLESSIKKKYIAKVGILNSAERNDGKSGNAEIGVVHEFGSFSRNIPARSFLRAPLREHGKEIVKEIREKALKAFLDGKPKDAYKILGIAGENVVQQAFDTAGGGKWAPLKARTIKRKGSSRPLIDTAQLAKSITSKVATK